MARRYVNPKSYVDEARRAWPHAAWIIGQGPYASVATCGTTGVMLFGTIAEAAQAKAFIGTHGYGGECSVDHRYVDSAHEIIDVRHAVAEHS